MNQKSQTNCLVAYKHIGQTPLECITSLKERGIISSNTISSYAGRLDPMASGLLLILLNEETKKRDTYEQLHKEYSFEVLFGVSTDTYDVLGLVTEVSKNAIDLSKNELARISKEMIGTFVQPYPPYSSALVDGKPLWEWARMGELSHHTIPTKEVTISKLSVDAISTVTKDEIKKLVQSRIRKVSGDFRQEEIVDSWTTALSASSSFTIAAMHAVVSSGTYVRSIADTLGQKLGVPSLAFSIARSKIGNVSLESGEEYRYVSPQELGV